MFEFLNDWDDSLSSFEKDIELSIKGEVKSWVTHAQIFCERVFKIYNRAERFFSGRDKITLGSFLNDDGFCKDFMKKTGFRNFNEIDDINILANSIKHNGNQQIINGNTMQKLLQSMHLLALKTYNYLEKKDVEETFDALYFVKLSEEKDNALEEIIAYADNLIIEKNKLIIQLNEDLEVMNQFSREDIKKQALNEKHLKHYIRESKVQNEVIRILMSEVNKYFEQMSDIDKEKYRGKEIEDFMDFINGKEDTVSWFDYLKLEKDKNSNEQREYKVEAFSNGYEDCYDVNPDDMSSSYFEDDN